MSNVSSLGALTAFAAGIVSFLSPCVLPLVPGYLSYVAGHSAHGAVQPATAHARLSELGLSALFVLGFSTVFVALGASATALGRLLLAYRYESNIVGGTIIALFGLFMTGLVKLPWLRPGENRISPPRIDRRNITVISDNYLKRSNMSHKTKAFGLIVLSLGVCLALPARAASSVTLTHVHGLSYSADGKQIFVPSHHGIATYSSGKWSKAAGPEHDYMGFSSTKQFFYSSGHPVPGSGLVNPLGLIKSSDGGRTWQKRGLEGESDFHLMATSYGTNAVYVFTHAPSSRMSKPGIYSTVNDGFAWKRAESKGLEGSLLNLAVHPSNNRIVAAGTKTGLFFSTDGGDNFKRLASGEQVLAAFFDLDDKQLWFSSYGGKPALTRLDWNSGKKTVINLPPLTRDAVAYIAQNPINLAEYAIATFERNVYLTQDQGKTWNQIANRGQTQ